MASRISKQRGVTLVELVVTIVLMGILAGGTVAFVISSTQSYVDTATRNQLSAIGRIATQKLEQAIRLAVPNSIRVTTADSRVTNVWSICQSPTPVVIYRLILLLRAIL